MSLLTISPSPHVRSSMTTQKIMLLVVLALVPAIVAATVVFGPRALFMVIYCAVISMFTELVCQRLMQKEVTVTDGSAMLTGVLLALNLPVTLPLWEAAIGCVFAVAVVKQLFGGLGCNFANPAITGRVFLLLSFGGDMTTWVKPFYYQGNNFIVKQPRLHPETQTCWICSWATWAALLVRPRRWHCSSAAFSCWSWALSPGIPLWHTWAVWLCWNCSIPLPPAAK